MNTTYGTTASASSNFTQPKISEIEIPGLLNMEFDKNTSSNIMNISYTSDGDEKYLLINITKLTTNELDPDNNCIEVNQNETGETLYSCFSSEVPGTSSAFCNSSDECVQAGGRPR
ncbi:hypothetical protein [Candidatus Nitrosocosmicus sp. SS]|uniref:hypothetical protein n=1 Tax=Candidatus Nitrosocosmicus agrestis TaxID=2563600 RepID=UPI0013316B45|nr:hypothetical protein [Candidatus Nitrosocosmicus sp. SS]KAF0868756.1 hypothetical protein E5N71_08735 [Candidatus Nitrosocosmicus sp. SS]MDR4489655.1 hypothetical protein [Candidatus Nitrosocosmicus sp.]